MFGNSDRSHSLQFLKRFGFALFTGALISSCANGNSGSSGPASTSTSSQQNVALTACQVTMQSQLAASEATKMNWYTSHGSPTPLPAVQTQIMFGTNSQTVVILHGFTSNPSAEADVASALQKDGYTVLVPLLTGWGSDANAANKSGVSDWLKAATDAIAIAQLCPNPVSLIGHSLGGALVTDIMVNNRASGVVNVSLLAPALETNVTSLLKPLLQTLLLTTDVIDMDTFQTLTGIDPSTFIPKSPAGQPEPFMPLQALNTVIQYESVFDGATTPDATVPALLVLSDADPFIDDAFDISYVSSHFPSVDQLIYPLQDGIGHSFELKANNPYFSALVTRIEQNLNTQ